MPRFQVSRGSWTDASMVTGLLGRHVAQHRLAASRCGGATTFLLLSVAAPRALSMQALRRSQATQTPKSFCESSRRLMLPGPTAQSGPTARRHGGSSATRSVGQGGSTRCFLHSCTAASIGLQACSPSPAVATLGPGSAPQQPARVPRSHVRPAVVRGPCRRSCLWRAPPAAWT